MFSTYLYHAQCLWHMASTLVQHILSEWFTWSISAQQHVCQRHLFWEGWQAWMYANANANSRADKSHISAAPLFLWLAWWGYGLISILITNLPVHYNYILISQQCSWVIISPITSSGISPWVPAVSLPQGRSGGITSLISCSCVTTQFRMRAGGAAVSWGSAVFVGLQYRSHLLFSPAFSPFSFLRHLLSVWDCVWGCVCVCVCLCV